MSVLRSELDPAAPARDPQTLDEMLAGKYGVPLARPARCTSR